MKKKYLSYLLLTISMGSQSIFSAENNSNIIFDRETITNPNGTQCTLVKDNSSNSVSSTISSNKKIEGQKVRLLSLDGGGLRGLFEIAELAVLEEILNHEINKDKNNSNSPLRIKDIFELGAGTSTGSILTAGLFSNRNYTAIDFLKLYAHHSTKIFDEHLRITGGIVGAKYSNDGLSNLLETYFGNDGLTDVTKPIYIVAFNCETQEPVVFSTHRSVLPQDYGYNYQKTLLVDVIKTSAAAPTYFEAQKILVGAGKRVQMVDGGIIANNPAHLAYQESKILQGENVNYEVYSFGTGEEPIKLGNIDSGVAAALPVIQYLFAGQVNTVNRNLVIDVIDRNAPLSYFSRINPRLEEGKGGMDDTSSAYVNYALHKAFSVTKEAAFADMVQHLGFNMPSIDELLKIQETVKYKLESLSSTEYNSLSALEKEYVKRKALDLDFRCYQYMHTDAKLFNHEESNKFLTAFLKDAQAKVQNNNNWGNFLWNTVTFQEDSHDTILQYIPRCLEFHTETMKLPPVTIQEMNTPSDELIRRIYDGFIDICNGLRKTSKFDYSSHNANHLNIVALVYIKDLLREVESTLTVEQLEQLASKLSQHITNVVDSRSYTMIGKYVRSTRGQELPKAILAFKDKIFSQKNHISSDVL